jgi:hypothetical protein
MSYLIVLPSIYKPYTHDCLNSMASELRANTLLIDNTFSNIGVSKSWNAGVKTMYQTGREWLVLCSAAIRFGEAGGQDFIAGLQQPFEMIEARPVYGWHLIAFHRDVFDRIGRFDENFWNYYGDIDWTVRIQAAYKPKDPPWNKITIDVTDMGMGHGLKLAGVQDTADPYIEYFQRKWGRHPDHSAQPSYARPFDQPSNELDYWPNA